MRRTTLIPILLSLLVACTSQPKTPLSQYFEDLGYIALYPARSEKGAGTIFEVIGNREQLMASRETNECLSKLPVFRHLIELPQKEIILNRSTKANASFTTDTAIDPAAAFKDKRVAEVHIRFDKGFEEQIPIHDLKKFVEDLPDGDICKDLFLSTNSRIIVSVIGANAVEYSFHDFFGRQIELDTALLSRVGGSISKTEVSDSRTTLMTTQPLIYGMYAPWTCEVISCDGMTTEQRRQLRHVIRDALSNFVDKDLYIAPDIPDRLKEDIKWYGIAPENVLLAFNAKIKSSRFISRGFYLTGSRIFWQSNQGEPEISTYENALLTQNPSSFGFKIRGRQVYLEAQDSAGAAAAMIRVIEAIAQQRAAWSLHEP